MAYVFITLSASLILNLAVLTLLKIGLRDSARADDLAGCQTC